MLARRLWPFVFLALPGFFGIGCSGDVGGASDEAPSVEEAGEDAANGDGVAYPSESLAPEEGAEPGSLAERLQNASIVAQVKMQLVQETALRPYTFDVQAEGGRVTLAGRVPSAEARAQAEQVANRVEGVREVHNRIEAPGAPSPAEERLAAEAEPPQERTPAAGERRAEAAEETVAEEATTASPSASASSSEPSYHTVQSGESLWVIARRYDLSVSQLRALNNLGSSNNLRPGQRLRVQ